MQLSHFGRTELGTIASPLTNLQSQPQVLAETNRTNDSRSNVCTVADRFNVFIQAVCPTWVVAASINHPQKCRSSRFCKWPQNVLCMIWGVPNGQVCSATMPWDGVEIAQKRKRFYPHLYPIFKPTMFVDFGVRHVRMNSVIFWSKSLRSSLTVQLQLKDSNVQLENHLPIREGLISHVFLVAENWQVGLWRATDAATPGWTTGWSRTTSWDKLMPLYVGNPMVKNILYI